MTLRARCISWAAPWLLFCWAIAASSAEGQACPSGSYCFYVPSGLPLEGSHSTASSRIFDIVISSPVRTVTGSYAVGSAAATNFSVSPGNSARIVLGASGPASAYNVPEQRGVFIVADSPDLTVDHRETFDQEQYSETIKRHEIALGTRFRLGGYSLNRENRPLAAVDAVLIYAPTGATISLSAPPNATLPFWNGSANANYEVTLAAGQTVAVRTVVGRDVDGALLTATAPVSVSSGGRGWSVDGCGDDGMDGLVPVAALGTEYVVRLPTGSFEGNGESRVRVIAEFDGTEVRVDGAPVATLTAGAFYQFAPRALSYVQTSRPALVWMNGSIDGCEVDTVLIPPIAFAPALTELSLDFNVPASDQSPAGEFAILIAGRDVPTIRLDGAAPTLISNDVVPLRPDLSYVRFNVTPGNRNVRAGSDFQAMLASRTEPSGLLAYYNPYRIPGCGDGALDPGELCDDGDLEDGDGCSSNCQVEPGYACSGAPSVCASSCGDGLTTPPSESCDDGNTTAGDGCNVTCRRELRLLTPVEGSVSNATMPLISGSADPNATITLAIGDVMTTLTADGAGRFSFIVPTVLADGSYTIRATATDVRGGVSMAARTITIDSTTSVTVSEPVTDVSIADSTPTVRGRGEPGATVEVRIDGAPVGSASVATDGSWELTVGTALPSGAHELIAEASDVYGNRASSAPTRFTIDDATFVTIELPSAGARIDTSTPELRGRGEPNAVVQLTIDGVPIATTTVDSTGTWSSRVPTPLADGPHRLTVQASDASGNGASATSDFVVETRREPLLLILNLPDGAFTRDPFPIFSGVADPGRHVLLTFDGVAIDSVTSTVRGAWSMQLLSALSPGVHTLEASTTDASGRTASDRHTFTFAAESSALSLLEPRAGSVLNDSTPTISGTAGSGARVRVSIDGVIVGETSALPDGRWTLDTTSPLPDGRHSVRAEASDGAINAATVEVAFFVDTATTVDILAPSGAVSSFRPSLVGSAEPRAIVTLELDGVSLGEFDVAADGTWSALPAQPLAPGAHTLRAVAVDALGNRAEDSQMFSIGGGEPDSDGDRLSDLVECPSLPCRDSDGDGTADLNDPDDDGDGFVTAVECAYSPCRNQDGDAEPDYLDRDDDGDGRPTSDERGSDGAARDTDSDGMPDHLDADDDGDSLTTITECATEPCVDSDGDATPDYLDFDDDNDRVPTARERADGMRAANDDSDSDGRVHWLDADANQNGNDDGTDGVADRDGDGLPDYIDLDTPGPGPIDVTDSGYAVAGGGGCSAGRARAGEGAVCWLLLLAATGLRRSRRQRSASTRG